MLALVVATYATVPVEGEAGHAHRAAAKTRINEIPPPLVRYHAGTGEFPTQAQSLLAPIWV